jgi:DnaJ-class molecular chaperone
MAHKLQIILIAHAPHLKHICRLRAGNFNVFLTPCPQCECNKVYLSARIYSLKVTATLQHQQEKRNARYLHGLHDSSAIGAGPVA